MKRKSQLHLVQNRLKMQPKLNSWQNFCDIQDQSCSSPSSPSPNHNPNNYRSNRHSRSHPNRSHHSRSDPSSHHHIIP